MVAQRQPSYTPEQYLAFERAGQSRHEYIGGQIIALAGGSENHNLIAAHLLGILYPQLRTRPYKAYPSDMRVTLRSGS